MSPSATKYVILQRNPSPYETPLTFLIGLLSASLSVTPAAETKSSALEPIPSCGPVAEYVWDDPQILRPYFANLHGSMGTKITRFGAVLHEGTVYDPASEYKHFVESSP